ncbi:MAG: hypothetical protein HFI91_01555 [Lachnospiraceae bacterium]|nr:hypothetical protein [Lachnospiraceae bacterium]
MGVYAGKETTVGGEEKGTSMEQDIENILKILDSFALGEESRMRLDVVETETGAGMTKVHHHGRCDIGSPWARGDCFDAGEGECDL